MAFKRYLSAAKVIELASTTRDGVFRELVDAIVGEHRDLDPQRILDEVTGREDQISTRIAEGIAIPHAQLAEIGTVILAVGRSRAGVTYDLVAEEKVHLIVMILGDDASHLEVLSQVVTKLAEQDLYREIVNARDVGEIFSLLTEPPPTPPPVRPSESSTSRSIFKHALRIADEVGAHAIMVHLAGMEIPDVVRENFDRYRFVFVSQQLQQLDDMAVLPAALVQLPFEGISRSSFVELSLLFAHANHLISLEEKVVGILGSPETGMWDNIIVIDTETEFRNFPRMDFLEDHALPEQRVLARALQIASRLSEEGREGKPVGTIFVLGDSGSVQKHCQQLVANPFKGYREEERNLLDPSLEETIKEYAKIDGSFVIRSDGVILSAGTYIRATNVSVQLPKGLGSCHMAAASITESTAAIAIAISESTRKISLFRKGRQMAID